MSRQLRRCLSYLPLVLLLGSICFAQFNSSVQGTVTDQAGAVVPGTKVTLHNIGTGIELNTVSNELGLFRFNSIAPGSYAVKFEAAGFAKKEITVQVTTNGTSSADAKLAVAGKTEEVTVTSEVAGVNTEETRVQATMSTRELSELPIMNRSVLQLAVVTPGIMAEPQGDQERRDSFEPGKPGMHANGRPTSSNSFSVDGLAVMSSQDRGTINLLPSPDMVQEAAFQATTFSVETGANSSIQADLTTKSGGNRYHGDIDYTYAGRRLAATREFASEKAPYKKYFLSGALGGPIVKDKTFFFGSVQKKFWQTSSNGLSQYVPTEFGQWVSQNLPRHSRVFDFLYNQPASRMDFVRHVQTAQDYMGADNCGTGVNAAEFGNIPCDMSLMDEGTSKQVPVQNGLQYNVRLDQYFNQGKDRFYLNFYRMDMQMDWLLFDRPSMDGKNYNTSAYINANYTHQFSNNMLNFASFGFLRHWGGIDDGPYSVMPFGGMVRSWNGPWSYDWAKCAHGDNHCFSGLGPMFWGAPLGPNQNREHNFNVRDYVNWVSGRHSVKVGGQVLRPDYWQNHGEYARAAMPWWNDYWDFVTGDPAEEEFWNISAQSGQYQSQIYGSKNWQYGLYISDDWKVTPNLLLSLGLRMDDFGNPSKYSFDSLPFVAVLPAGATPEGFAATSTKFVPAAFGRRQKGNFLPRVGFAWSPTQDKKLSIRGGFGYYMDSVTPAEVTANLPTQPPNRISLHLYNDFLNPDQGWSKPQDPFGLPGAPAPTRGFLYPDIGTPTITQRGSVILADGTPLPAGLNGIDYSLKPYKTMIWNLGVEREMAARLVASLLYSASHSWDQPYEYDYNVAFQIVNGGPARLTDAFGETKYTRNGLVANYNSLIASVRQNWKSIQWQSTYTFSHTKDDQGLENDGNFGVVNGYEPHQYYTFANYDIRHRFALSGIFTVPKLTNAVANKVVGGWQVGSVITAQTGTPFNPYSEVDLNHDGKGRDYPNYLGGYISGASKSQYISGVLTSDMFSTAGITGGQGDLQRNIFRNPGFFSVDTSLTKKITMPWVSDQKSVLSFRVEAINLFNRVNLQPMAGDQLKIGNAQFGRSVAAFNGRYVQLGARFEF